MCVHVNIFVHINEHIKLYEEYIIVNNGSLANEDNDHGGGEKKKQTSPCNNNVYNIFSFIRSL